METSYEMRVDGMGEGHGIKEGKGAGSMLEIKQERKEDGYGQRIVGSKRIMNYDTIICIENNDHRFD